MPPADEPVTRTVDGACHPSRLAACATLAASRLCPAKKPPPSAASRVVRRPACMSAVQYGRNSFAQSWKSGLRVGDDASSEKRPKRRLAAHPVLLGPEPPRHAAHVAAVRHSPPPSRATTSFERLAAERAGKK